jgi:hypothetical protein
VERNSSFQFEERTQFSIGVDNESFSIARAFAFFLYTASTKRCCRRPRPWLSSFSLGLMTRWRITIVFLLTLASCQPAEPKTTFVAHGQTYCAVHRIPLVTAHGYEAPAGISMRSRRPRYYPCEEKYPNHIWATRSLYRSNPRNVPAVFSYCPRCEKDFWKCVG